MPLWFIYALATACFWGIGQIFLKKGFVYLGPFWNNALATLCAFLLFIPFALLNGINLSKISPFTYLIIFIIPFGYKIYYYALDKEKVALSGTIIATYPLITLLLSYIFLGERINPYQKIAISLVILGTVFIAFPAQKQSLIQILKSKFWLYWAFAHVITAGSADFLSKLAINSIGAFNYLFLFPLFDILAMLSLATIDRGGRKIPQVKIGKILPTFVGVFMIQAGIITFTLGFAHGPASLVAPSSSIYATITVVLAFLFLKEKVTKTQLAGIILTIIAIILFGVS